MTPTDLRDPILALLTLIVSVNDGFTHAPTHIDVYMATQENLQGA